MNRSREAWSAFILTRLVGLAVDSAVVGAAYLAAFILRFDFAEPSWGWRKVAMSYVTVCVVHILSLMACGCYRLAWRRIRASQLPRYVGAAALAAALLTAMRFLMPELGFAHIRPPYSITVICFFFATAGLVGVRYMWRAYWLSRQKESALLERSEKTFDNSVAARFFAGRTVMVTGAGGSIGSEIVRQVSAAGAARVLLVERGENALYEINREMAKSKCAASFSPLMVDCGDRDRMSAVFAAERPSIVLHAAAYKHVPMVEMNPEEGWRNNTEATRTLAALAKENGVERFVMISTDKAVNPVSVMGKTKLAAEQAIMAMNDSSATSFCAVRFGNVFGSSGKRKLQSAPVPDDRILQSVRRVCGSLFHMLF